MDAAAFGNPQRAFSYFINSKLPSLRKNGIGLVTAASRNPDEPMRPTLEGRQTIECGEKKFAENTDS
jgi:hypothetical protein